MKLGKTLFLIFIGFLSQAQLTVDNSLTPQQLVEDVLVGEGIHIVSVSYTGDPSQIASFGGNVQNLQVSQGIMLASGNCSTAIGPNNDGSAGTDLMRPGYPDLTTLGGNETHDAAILEFQFVPSTNKVSFQYVFASDEYPEFVCASVNDAFGFFLSGPGINGPYADNAENLAIIPNTTTPVSINTVNPGSTGGSGGGGSPCDLTNDAYYVSNGDGMQGPFNTDNTYLQYDGMTVVLKAEHDVIPCELYTIKMVIADGGDGVYDSGVFLEKGSFTAGNLLAGIDLNTPNSYASESCDQASLVLNFPDTLLNDTTITIELLGSAENGVDYTYINPDLNISAGEISYTLDLFPLADGLNEGSEEIIIIVPTSACGADTVRLEIQDYIAINAEAYSDTLLCAGEMVELTATASGGGGVHYFEWMTNGVSIGNNDTISVVPDSTTIYYINVSDDCINEDGLDSVVVDVFPIPHAFFDTTLTMACIPFEYQLINNSNVSTGTLNYEWIINGDTLIGESPLYSVETTGINYISLNVESSEGCRDTFMHHGFLFGVGFPNAGFSVPDTLSEFQNQVSVFNSSEGSDSCKYYVFNVETNHMDSVFECDFEYEFENIGLYQITQIVYNEAGCSDTIFGTTEVFPDLAIYFPNAFTPDGNGLNDTYAPKGSGIIDFELAIFNRWGELVYETDAIEDGWNGQLFNTGEQLPLGVYVYKYSVSDVMGEIHTGFGKITLVR